MDIQIDENSIKEFKDLLKGEVDEIREETGEGSKKAFVSVCCKWIQDDDLVDVVPLYYDKKVGAHRIAIDGYAINTFQGTTTLSVVIADYNNFDFDENFTQTQFEEYVKRAWQFVYKAQTGVLCDQAKDYIEFSTPEYEFASSLEKEFEFDKIRIIVISDRLPSLRLKAIFCEDISAVSVSTEVWTFDKLYEIYKANIGHELIVHRFDEQPVKLFLASEGVGFKSYQGVIDATLITDLYNKYGSKLLEGNVRSFLSFKTSVNKDIRKTIKSEPERFFVYNNGLAMTARDLKFNTSGDLVGATDIQIINGGQTTAALSKCRFNDKVDISKIKVALKLTEIGKNLSITEAEDLICQISHSSNNQNAIKVADLSSNHPFHINLESMASRIKAPAPEGEIKGYYWFYERSRGSFDLAKEQRNLSNKHRVKKEEVAKVLCCWDQQPEIVSKGSTKAYASFMIGLKSNWDRDRKNGLYGDDFFKKVISLYIMFKNLEKAVSIQPWYSGSYRANIVTYAISAFSWLFAKRYGKDRFNFRDVWQAQKTPTRILEALIELAKIAMQNLTKEDRQKVNVTEWAKYPKCWSDMQSLCDNYELPDLSNYCLSDIDAVRVHKNEADNAKIDEEVEAFSKAVGFRYWREALEYDKIGVLSIKEKGCMRAMLLYPKKLPTKKQVAVALEGLEKLNTDGFEYTV